MIGPITNSLDGKKEDAPLHEEILGAVNFTRSPAYQDSINRLVKMGYSLEEAEDLLK